MIKNIKFFINDNEESIKYGKIVKEDFYKNGFNIVDDNNYDLGVAIGGDGSFLRMIKDSNYNSEPCYIGINTGHLGFLQEVKVNEHNKLINEIKEGKYKIVKAIIQKILVKTNNEVKEFNSLNEILIRDKNLDLLKANIFINNDLLENIACDGIMISTPTGSTAYNLSYNGAIIYPPLEVLQITPIGAIDNKRFNCLRMPVVIPSNMEIDVKPVNSEIKLSIDGPHIDYDDVESISCTAEEKIKCLKFSHYSFTQKINEKFLV